MIEIIENVLLILSVLVIVSVSMLAFWEDIRTFLENIGTQLCNKGYHKLENMGKGYKYPPCSLKKCSRCGIYQFTVYSREFPLSMDKIIKPGNND